MSVAPGSDLKQTSTSDPTARNAPAGKPVLALTYCVSISLSVSRGASSSGDVSCTGIRSETDLDFRPHSSERARREAGVGADVLRLNQPQRFPRRVFFG